MTTTSVRGTRLGKYVRIYYCYCSLKYGYREGILRQPQIAFGRSSPIFTSVARTTVLASREHFENFVRSWKIRMFLAVIFSNAHRAPPRVYVSFVLNRKTMTHRRVLVDVARAPDDVRDRRCL